MNIPQPSFRGMTPEEVGAGWVMLTQAERNAFARTLSMLGIMKPVDAMKLAATGFKDAPGPRVLQ